MPARAGAPVAAIAIVALLAIAGIELTSILRLNDGRLVFSLDDAAIHLALAENIARGDYGVNLGEFSAPASSIAWPFLIAPFARLRFAEYAVLAINLAAAIGTVLLFAKILARPFRRFDRPDRRGLAIAVVLLLVPATNLVGLIFTGMEHSLQVCIAAAIVFGIVCEQERREASWWLYVAIAAAPLVRYENLALAAPALAYLAVRRHYRGAAACAIVIVCSLASFSVLLHAHGLGWLPSSVLVKSDVLSSGGAASAILRNFGANLLDRQGRILGVAWIVLGLTALDSRRTFEQRSFAAWTGSALTLHMFLGAFGWYHRYEIYIWTTTLLSFVYLFGATLVDRFFGGRLLVPVLALSAATWLLARPYIDAIVTTPLACNNIYDQQYQLHRFLVDYWQAPAAVNDLGWTSYRNDEYVLDLFGLGNRQALLSAKRASADWMNVLARQRNVKLAMVYPRMIGGVPGNWTLIGELVVGRTNYSAFDTAVSFYALDEAAASRAKALLGEFQRTLPAGARFVFRSESGRQAG